MLKYTRMARGQYGVEVKSMIDLVLEKKDMLLYVQGVRGMGCGLSYYHVVLRKVRSIGTWIKRREVVNGAKKI